MIGIPLQYPSGDLMKIAMQKLYGTNLNKYQGQVAYIQLDTFANTYKKISNDTLKANVVKPEIWEEAIEIAESMVEKTELGVMVFGSALNLLLFSRTYKTDILNKLKGFIKNDKSKTYVFAVSTSAFADEIRVLEEAADNLMFTRMEKPMKLFIRVDRMKGNKFLKEETEVPISEEMLREIKAIAEITRKTRIPEIRRI